MGVSATEQRVVWLVADGVVARLVADTKVSGSKPALPHHEFDRIDHQPRRLLPDAAQREVGDDDDVRLSLALVLHPVAGARRHRLDTSVTAAARRKPRSHKYEERRSLHANHDPSLGAVGQTRLVDRNPYVLASVVDGAWRTADADLPDVAELWVDACEGAIVACGPDRSP